MINLDDEKVLEKVDRENMLKLLLDFPAQCREAQTLGPSLSIPERYSRSYSSIVFLGLGGSAIGADIIKDYLLDRCRLPVYVNRDYEIPAFVGTDTLIFACSYSGNTEETLNAYGKAREKDAPTVVITSGGKLKELAEKNKDILISIPAGLPPRCALGYSFIPSLISLSKLHIISGAGSQIDEACGLLSEMGISSLWPGAGSDKNIAKKIAKKIFSRFPVIYASSRLAAVVTRWKGQLAENSKTLSSGHVYPEMNHNEIVGWDYPKEVLKKFTIIQLRDGNDHARVKRRMDITSEILKKEGFDIIDIESRGKGFLSRMLSLVYTGDFVSYYLAVLNGVDPTPVDRVTYLKKKLAKV